MRTCPFPKSHGFWATGRSARSPTRSNDGPEKHRERSAPKAISPVHKAPQDGAGIKYSCPRLISRGPVSRIRAGLPNNNYIGCQWALKEARCLFLMLALRQTPEAVRPFDDPRADG